MFGFLKNKLKEWVGKAKEKLKPEEKLLEEEKVEEKKEIKKEKVEKKKKAKKENVIKESPKIDAKEDGTAIEIETEIEEGVPQDFIDKELEAVEEKAKAPVAEEVKKAEEEIKKTQEIVTRVEEGKESAKKAVEELERIEEKKEEGIANGAEEKTEKKSFFQRLKSSISYKITETDFNNLFDDLEMLLLENNVALEVVDDIKNRLSKKLIGREINKDKLEHEIRKELKSTLNEILIDPDNPIDAVGMKKEKPFVVLFFGINGSGKTTSIAKFAYALKNKDYSVVLAAGDTFRAASIEQIEEHAKKLEITLIKQDYKSDPAAVGFDAIKYAKNHGIDVVLIDTAGRMHTRTNLIEEMKKICRVTNPDLKIFVAESIAGNDAVEQAKTFHEAIEIDGSILSKADIDEKGGTIISVSYATRKPIFYLGVGQEYKDLKLFDKEEFIRNLGL